MRRGIASTNAHAQEYFGAAEASLKAARLLYSDGNYSVAIYLAGLSVECVLRAYIRLIDNTFYSDHKLTVLKDKSGFEDKLGSDELRKLSLQFSIIVSVWDNSHRFKDSTALARYLKPRARSQGIRGDFIKEFARQNVEAAFEIVNLAQLKWKVPSSRFKNQII